MTLPAGVRASVERALGPIHGLSPVGGGCISQALRADTAAGAIFLKHNPDAPAGMFSAEADGLRALRIAADGALRIPDVLALDEADDGRWIALEWLQPAPRGALFSERLGRGLAALHRHGGGSGTAAARTGAGDDELLRRGESGWESEDATASRCGPGPSSARHSGGDEPISMTPALSDGGWGWARANFIGSLPQDNRPAATWAGFWAERRFRPQLEMARAAGREAGPSTEWEMLFDRLPELLAPAEDDRPSLLHGDLWGGNVHSAAGEPALIDPAVYRGHREADLAMAELFGGFDARFHAAYAEAWPLLPGYREARRAIYQLYYLLVHVNLFGGGYGARTAATLRRALGGG